MARRTSGGTKLPRETVFQFWELQEAAAAHAGFTTSKAETDLPVAYLDDSLNPNDLKRGIIKRIHIRLKWANAVTLTALRIYFDAVAGDYESSVKKLWDSKGEFPAGLVDDTEYDVEVEIPFMLKNKGVIYYAPEWSAACGNIQGYIFISGVILED